MPLRSLLLVSIALLGASSLSAQEYRGPVIDAHAHIRLGDDDALSDDQGKGTPPIRALDSAAGIAKSALIVIAHAGDLPGTSARNDAVIAAAASDPQHFYAVASVHPRDGAAAITELDRLAKLGVRQIKLHPNAQQFDVADPAVARITEHCGKLGIAVLFDSYNPLDPAQVGKLVVLTVKQPKTRFVLAHMTFSQFRETMTFAMFRKMGRSDNVWFDISAIAVAYAGSPVQPELVWTMRQLGTNRIIFGSDWPVDTPATALAAARKLGLTPDEQKQVLHDNVVALLGLKPAAGSGDPR
ncbi:amidohydrolase family protein [Sphingomonas koreensis]